MDSYGVGMRVIEGLRGHYKSYQAVVWLVEDLGTGHVVCTNLPLKLEPIRKYLRMVYKWELADEQLIILGEDDLRTFHEVTPPGTAEKSTMVYIDESHLKFNARDWHDQDRGVLNFLTLSRHERTEVTWISQHADNIDKQVRRLVEFYYDCRDLGRYMPLFSMFYMVNKWDSGHKNRLKCNWRLKNKAIYDLYDSWAIVEKFKRRKAVDVKNTYVVPFWRTAYMKALLILLGVIGVCVYFGMRGGSREVQKESASGRGIGRGLFSRGGADTKRSAGGSGGDQSGVTVISDRVVLVKLKGIVTAPGRVEVWTDVGTFVEGQVTEIGIVLRADRTGVIIEALDGKRLFYIFEGAVGDMRKVLRSGVIAENNANRALGWSAIAKKGR